jgi:hypothetical protein
VEHARGYVRSHGRFDEAVCRFFVVNLYAFTSLMEISNNFLCKLGCTAASIELFVTIPVNFLMHL